MTREPEFKRFFGDNAESKRYDYPSLTHNSLVMDIGAYEGGFANSIINKYGCNVIGYEPVDDFIDDILERDIPNYQLREYGLSDTTGNGVIYLAEDGSSSNTCRGDRINCRFRDICEELDELDCDIDLMKINIEGDEFPLLDKLVNSKHIKRIKNIQVQFHNFIDDCEEKRDNIIKELSKTHRQTWCYYFVWENWELK